MDLEASISARELTRQLGQLMERDRQLLWLAHVEGLSHREIPPALRRHIEHCEECSAAARLHANFVQLGRESSSRPLPDPGVIWRRNQEEKRRREARLAALPVALAERFSWLVAAVVALVSLGSSVPRLLSGTAGAPREVVATTAQGPADGSLAIWIGVVALLIVVGLLAQKEWLATQG